MPNFEEGYNPEREDLFSSKDLEQLYEQLDFYCNRKDKTKKQKHKKEMVEKIRTSENFSRLETTLQKNPMLYIGSGADMELPLLLGAREVVMVERKEVVDEIKDKLKDLDKDVDVKEMDDYIEIKFDFNFGEGDEEVKLKVYERKIYGNDDLVERQKEQIKTLQDEIDQGYDLSSQVEQISRFEASEKFGAILACGLEGQQIDQDKRAFSSLMEKGYVISNRTDNLTRDTEQSFESASKQKDFLFAKKA